MLDAFIIEQIRTQEEAERQRKGQQPYLPVPTMPYRPPEREGEPVRRWYYDSGDNDFDPRRDSRDDCVVNMAAVTRVKYTEGTN